MPNDNTRRAKATELIRQYMFGSLAKTMMPSLPLLDDAVECEVRLRLVQALAKNYSVNASSQQIRSVLAALVGIGPSGMAVKLVSDAITPSSHGDLICQEAQAFIGESLIDGAQEFAGRLIKTVVPGARLVLDFSEILKARATLYAVGCVFMKHFEAGGTIKSFNAVLFKEDFEKDLLIGHKIVEISAMKGHTSADRTQGGSR